jgi:HSP20 family molecular chaperone IbpA
MKQSYVKIGILCGSIAAALSLSPASAATPAPDSTKGQPPAAEKKSPDATTNETWSDRIFDEFQGMERRMDQIFNDAVRGMNQRTTWIGEPGFSSSVKLSEDHGNYVVRVALPDRDLSNVTATVENNKTLRITAKEEKKEAPTSASKQGDKNAPAPGNTTYKLERYEQILSLPGPVNAAKMQIDRSGSTVTITLPKE